MPVAKIAKKLVDSLKSAEKQYLVHDQLLKGFGVRVAPKGHKAFFIDYRPGEGGRKVLKKCMVIGVVGKLTCDQARNLAREKLAAVQLGGDPAADREKKRQTLNLREFAKRYLDEEAVRRLKPSTICNYEINLRRHAYPHIGHLKITEIARTDIIQMHNAIGEKSPITANRTVETVSTVFRYAQDKGLVEEGYNPTKGIRSFKESHRERFLSEDEFVRLGATLRLAETEGILWANLARDEQSKHTVKTGARAVVLNQLSQDILKRQISNGAYVFPTEFEDKPRADLNKPWRAVRRHADLEDVRLHDLRHSFASVGASAGMGLPIVGTLLGHKQATTTERYALFGCKPASSSFRRN